MGAKIRGNGRKTQRRLRVLSERVEHPEQVWPSVERTIYDAEREQWDSKGAFMLGRPWKRLDARYASRKSSGQRSPLVLSGSLRASFTGVGEHAIRVKGKSSIRLGSSHPLARLHQSGSKAGQVPSRPMLRLTKVVRAQVKDAIRDALLDG